MKQWIHFSNNCFENFTFIPFLIGLRSKRVRTSASRSAVPSVYPLAHLYCRLQNESVWEAIQRMITLKEYSLTITVNQTLVQGISWDWYNFSYRLKFPYSQYWNRWENSYDIGRSIKSVRKNAILWSLAFFLDASSHLYKRVCPSVGPLVGRSVGWSVRP